MPMNQITSPDRVLQTIQTNAANAISNLESATQIDMTAGAQSTTGITTPFANGGHLITNVTLTAGQDNLVAHGLGSVPQIWVPCGINVNATVWSPLSTTLKGVSSNSMYINLWASSTATFSFWVA